MDEEFDDYKSVNYCKHCSSIEDDVEMRYDYYGIPTGLYCDDCYENHYPYKREAYYDYFDAGEYLEEDY